MTEVTGETAMLPIATSRRTWAVLRAEARGHQGLAVGTLAVSVGACLAGLVAPWALGGLVDDIAGGEGGDRVWFAVLVIAGAAIVGGVLTGVGAALVARLGETILARIRERVVDRALHLPSATIERVGTGDLVSRVGDDVSVVTGAITTTGPEVVQAVLTVVLTGAGLFVLDWRLGLAGLAAAPMYVLAVRWYLPRSAPFYARERAAVGRRTQELVSSLRGGHAIRAHRLEHRHTARIDARSTEAVDLSLGVFWLFTRFASRLNRAEFVGLTAVLTVGFLLVRGDLVTIGAATAAALYFHRLFNPIGVLVLQFDELQEAGASLARLAGVVDLPLTGEPADPDQPADWSLEVTAVSHSYDAGPPALREVTVRVGAGERVALVGASGAGKTTLAAVAAGVLSPTTGAVRLGGVELTALGEHRVRTAVALLSQEVHVFSCSLLDDLRLARPDTTDDEALAALDVVGALGWVRALPDGLATEVGEGGHVLTSAQSQQVALARLVLADPPVAILDEATAEAGSAGARALEAAALAATEGRTTLVIAHRLTQAATADRVIVLDEGVVVESGTHDDLLAAGGRYGELWWSWTGTRER
ncbi:MAG: ABC transporter ATP-binding protein [Actinophytocola sp.]|uniref:ABC transporter ATP-binding protein n=1 Tax=Actinophytocola sp. TaxID=1872138 RepID=UPI003C774523